MTGAATNTMQIPSGLSPFRRTGRVSRVVGLEIEVKGLNGGIGDAVLLGPPGRRIRAEVVAVSGNANILMPLGPASGLSPNDPAELVGGRMQLPVSDSFRGRVINAFGEPIDDVGAVPGPIEIVPFDSAAPSPLARRRIDEPLPLGVRSLDALLPCGRGQRVGVFAGSGVGKSTLLGMMARGAAADVVVVSLVGERGREVREFLEDDLGPEGRANATVVVATSDEPAMLRVRAAFTATRIAEWHAAQGRDVLLLMDSLTRVAMAQREIGLAAGEPPTTRGYPPSVFALLASLLERAGPHPAGTITGLYTVLVEGDDLDEPITDHARSILDGHYVLTRRLATAGHFPSIDVPASTSRLVSKILNREQIAEVNHVRALLSALAEGRDLIELGAYVPGTNPILDRALMVRDQLDELLRQDASSISSWDEARRMLTEVTAS
jgi:flagellum-specific ATP synthase